MELPLSPVASKSQSPKSLIIYGPPKVGKTSVLAALDNNLITDCEDGSDFVTALKVKATSLGDIKALGEAIKTKGYPYPYVSVDTIDKIEEWCETHATTMYRQSLQGKNFAGRSVLELPNGGGYMWLRQSFHTYFGMLKSFAPRVIFVGHIRDKFLEVNGKEVTAKDLDLTGKIKSIVCSNVDAIGHMFRTKEGKLMLSFKTTENVVCGSRCPHLKGQEFEFGNPASMEDWKKIYID
jgi:AAA domain